MDGGLETTPAGGQAIDEVSVTGTAAHADRALEPPGDTEPFDESCPSGIKISVVSLPLTQLSGVERRFGLRPVDQRQGN